MCGMVAHWMEVHCVVLLLRGSVLRVPMSHWELVYGGCRCQVGSRCMEGADVRLGAKVAFSLDVRLEVPWKREVLPIDSAPHSKLECQRLGA